MFASLVTFMLNKKGIGDVFWHKEKWLHIYYMALGSLLGPHGGLVGLRHCTLRFKVFKPTQELSCIPSRWCFHNLKSDGVHVWWDLECSTRKARHPWGCKACWDNAGEPQREPELALDCPRCLLGVPAVPHVMLAISGRVLMDTGHSYMRNDTDNLVGCTMNTPELVSNSALDLLAVPTLPLGSVVVEFWGSLQSAEGHTNSREPTPGT